jgi:hypothetical protein
MKQLKRTLPEYPIFLIETPKTGVNCSVYWVSEEFADIEFLGSVPYSTVMDDEALDNLLELSVDELLRVYVGGKVVKNVLLGGVCIGTLHQKGDFYWHHVFAAEKRRTITAAARAMYKTVRRHRTTVGENVLHGLQQKRNF